MSSPDGQLDFNFAAPTARDGLARWREERLAARRKLAAELNLPLEHPVEVWLVGSVRLRGTMQLAEEALFLEAEQADRLLLEVDGVVFSRTEMESWLRLD